MKIISVEKFNKLCEKKPKTQLEKAKRFIKLFETPDSVFKRYHMYAYATHPTEENSLLRIYIGPIVSIIRQDGYLQLCPSERIIIGEGFTFIGIEMTDERNKHFQTKQLQKSVVGVPQSVLALCFNYRIGEL